MKMDIIGKFSVRL